jgi:L-ascorbate metabolism protein UlaG (beta-lactamase superfamily)
MKIINNDSFKAESSETTGWGDTFEVGTVEVTLCQAHRERIHLYHFWHRWQIPHIHESLESISF